jgi:hypothetical protein
MLIRIGGLKLDGWWVGNIAGCLFFIQRKRNA